MDEGKVGPSSMPEMYNSLKDFMKLMIDDVKRDFQGVRQDIHDVKSSVTTALSLAQEAKVTADEAKQQVAKVEREVMELKEQVNSFKDGGLARAVEHVVHTKWTAQTPQSSSAGSSKFVPTEVCVQGFYDWKNRTGALSEAEADELAGKLLSMVPDEIANKFKLVKEHAQYFRLKFSTTEGGEPCWKLREHLVGAITKSDIKVKDKELTVRVQDAPDMQIKRANYWRAVDAIKRVGTEDVNFILVPKSFGIHDATDLTPMGHVTDRGYVWDEAVVRKALPSANIMELKKAALNIGRRR